MAVILASNSKSSIEKESDLKSLIMQLTASVWNTTSDWRRSRSSYRASIRTATVASKYESSLLPPLLQLFIGAVSFRLWSNLQLRSSSANEIALWIRKKPENLSANIYALNIVPLRSIINSMRFYFYHCLCYWLEIIDNLHFNSSC